uniref:Uncharacterized protein n=1 Tax=Morchella brunnea TaxID=1174671 RepID=A0A8K1I822_9PEZI|nr:hypothetical protein LK370_mgp196 [Morchella brunnea]UBU98437.1 hypothetical protein [Morchella brunnea]
MKPTTLKHWVKQSKCAAPRFNFKKGYSIWEWGCTKAPTSLFFFYKKKENSLFPYLIFIAVPTSSLAPPGTPGGVPGGGGGVPMGRPSFRTTLSQFLLREVFYFFFTKIKKEKILVNLLLNRLYE